jgi:exodeoxyribonuclease VII large subunit
MSSSFVLPDTAWLSVSALNTMADALLRDGIGMVHVEGEVSNLRRYASGHQYFSLKDAGASISCTLFRGNLRYSETFADGDHVRVGGRVGIYAARGQYQLIVESLSLAGEGRLLAAFEALRKRLLAEGLFAPERKRKLPAFVYRLGVITSPQGDVRHDIERTLARRFPLLLPFRLYPVAVQGAAAVPQIVEALRQAAAENAVDVLLLARGGGSLEDLWAFNSEEVARAIAACPIPVVAGIGHETDTTIADFVADLRASTPTAAAEAVSPDGQALARQIQQAQRRLQQRFRNTLEALQGRLGNVAHRLELRHPGRSLEQRAQRLDESAERLSRAVLRRLEYLKMDVQRWQGRLVLQAPERRHGQLVMLLRHLEHRLGQCDPQPRLRDARLETLRLEQRMQHIWQRDLRSAGDRLQYLQARLHSLSPEVALRRGYAILKDESGALVRDAVLLTPGQRLIGQLADGLVDLDVVGIHATSSAEPRHR